jgi:hypothetical protein
MLWQKSWFETRWRFLSGVALLILSSVGTVLTYPQVSRLLTIAPSVEATGPLGRMIKEGLEVSQTFRGYIWWQAFRQNLPQMGTLFAALLGTGGLLAQSSRGSALFTLSLPVSRNQVFGIRAAAGLAEWLVLSFAGPLTIVIVAPAINQHYGLVDALVHGTCFFFAGAAVYSLACLLSTSFDDLWRPLLIACAVALIVSTAESFSGGLGRYGIAAMMRAESYFRDGQLPWGALITSTALSAMMLYGASVNLARRDF